MAKSKKTKMKPVGIWEKFGSFLQEKLNYARETNAHRSFRLTSRYDIPDRKIARSYVGFTVDVIKMLWREKQLLSLVTLLYFVLISILVGIMSQMEYLNLSTAVRELLKESVGESSDALANIALLGVTIAGGGGQGMTEAQQVYLGLLNLFTWLVIVWLLRQRLLGVSVKLRDGLYNALTPLISTMVVIIVGVVQMIPAILGLLIFSVAINTGILQGGIEAAMFGIGAILLVVLSLYWVSSTVIAAVIVTLPGTYPLAALRSARGVVMSRRLAVILRLAWLALVLIVLWVLVLLPVIIVDSSLQIESLPLVPVTAQILSAVSMVFGSVYLYMLYRRMIDDEPA